MSAFIYLEGGATGPGSKSLDIRCERAFHKLLDGMGFTGRKPRLVACGGRGEVFNAFCRALRSRVKGYVAMWIDSEEPMANVELAWDHLAGVTTVHAWERPNNPDDDQVLFMTACMETWIVADRETLRAHYGHRLQESRLPPMHNLESRTRYDVQERLERATEDCQNAFNKGKRSFDVFGKLNPAALEMLPSFVRVARVLKKNLK